MPKGPQGQKRPADTVASALRGAKILTGEIAEDTDNGKDKAAQALGKKGGRAQADRMTPERRKEIAKAAAAKRWKKMIRQYFGFCQPHGCSATWRHGSAEGYVCTFGGNGRTAPTASRNCGAVACRSSTRRLPPARRPGSGACQDTRRSNRPCATPLSMPSGSPTLCLCPSLTRSNRRDTDPYARWCGRGGTARCPPIPINQQITGRTRRSRPHLPRSMR